MEERAYWLAWSQISGVGPILLRRLHRHFGTLAEAWAAAPRDLSRVDGFGKVLVEKVVQGRSQLDPEDFLKQHLQKNPDFWTPADPDYPRLLLETPNPPPVLYYRGQIDNRENQGIAPMVGIVGTRKPSEYGIRWTRRLSALLAKSGFTIVSGMAAGIDTEAHRACLEAGGRTLAIFGTHLDKVYPEQNRSLYQQIVKQGAAFSEYASGTQTKPEHFAQRNRIIAGLCRALLVMEAPAQSGALITAHVANDFGRDVYVLPGRIDDYNSQGCLRLLKNGADAIVGEELLLQMLGAIPQLDAPQQLSLFDGISSTSEPANSALKKGGSGEESLIPPLEPELALILQAVTTDPINFDLVVQQSGLPAASVSSALLQLELLGLVSQLPGMRYQRG